MAVVIADPGTLKVGLVRSVALCWRDLHTPSIVRAALTVKRPRRSFYLWPGCDAGPLYKKVLARL